MAERVVIQIDVETNTAGIGKTADELAALRAELEAMNADMGDGEGAAKDLDKELGNLDKSVGKNTKSFEQMTKQTSKTDSAMEKFKKTLGTDLNKALKDVGKTGQEFITKFLGGVKTVATADVAALLAVNVAFKVGAALARAYQAASQSLFHVIAAGAGVALVAVSALMAAQRQALAAASAYQYKSSASLGAGTPEATAELRALQNSKLSVLGTTSVNGAFQSVSQSSQVNASIVKALGQLGNFAVASGNPQQSIAAAGTFLGELTKAGKMTAAVQKLAEKVSPEFADALTKGVTTSLNKNGKKTVKAQTAAQILAEISNGSLETQAGVSGALDNQTNTLLGQFTVVTSRIKSQFADIGQQFLPDLTDGLDRVATIVQKALSQLTGSIQDFGKPSAINGLVNGFQKVVTFATHFLTDTLPKTDGMIGRIKTRFDEVKSAIEGAFGRVKSDLQPLVQGAQVITKAFGPTFKDLFSTFAGGVKSFSQLLIQNKGRIMDFANSLHNTFLDLAKLSGLVKQAFVNALPVLKPILDVLDAIVKAVTAIGKALLSIGGGKGVEGVLGALSAIGLGAAGYYGLGKLGIGGGGIISKVTSSTGKTVSATGIMNVTADVVNVNGGIGGLGGGVGAAEAETGAASGLVGPAVIGGEVGLGSKIAGGVGTLLSSPIAQVGMLIGAFALSQKSAGAKTQSGAVGSGAGAGALLGTVFAPGIGTLVGGALGAAGGGLYHDLIGKPAANKKLATSIASSQAGTIGDQVNKMIANGDVLGAEKALQAYTASTNTTLGFSKDFNQSQSLNMRSATANSLFTNGYVTADQAKALAAAPGTYMNELKKQSQALHDTINPQFEQFNQNLALLSKTTGMTSDQIAGFAQTAGIDLTNGVKNNFKTLEAVFGTSIAESAPALQDKINNAFSDAIDNATNPTLVTSQAQQAVDQSTSNINQLSMGGTIQKSDVADWIKTAADYENAKTYNPITGQDNSLDAYQQLVKMIGPGGDIFKKGNQLQGQESTVEPLAQPYLQSILTQTAQTAGFAAIQAIQGKLLKQGYALNSDQIVNDMPTAAGGAGGDSRLGGLTVAQLTSLQNLANSPDIISGTDKNILNETLSVKSILASLGVKSDIGYPLHQSQATVSANGGNPWNVWMAGLLGANPGSAHNPTLSTSDIPRALSLLYGTGSATRPMSQMRWMQTPGSSNYNSFIANGIGYGNPAPGASSYDPATGKFAPGTSALNAPGEGSIQSTIASGTSAQTQALSGTLNAGATTIANATSSALTDAGNGIISAIGGITVSGIQNPGGADNGGPNNGGGGGNQFSNRDLTGDTRTSRFGRTIGQHNRFNSMLAGKRTVSSGLRNYGLGSGSSDHLAGNAFDLVGTNLGSYKDIVDKNGGFAEFHGFGGNRHLHVVPGDGVGDTTMPAATAAIASPMDNINAGGLTIHVHPSQGMNEQALANKVADTIARKHRSVAERRY